MKNMKKQMTAGLLMVLMLVVSVFGNVTPANAATLTAKQYLAKMDKAYSKAKSVEMSQSTSVTMKMMERRLPRKHPETESSSLIRLRQSLYKRQQHQWQVKRRARLPEYM